MISIDGLMMDFQLTLPALLRRVETYFSDKTVVSRALGPLGPAWRTLTYGDVSRRARQLAVLLTAGRRHVRGERIATLCWNHHVHLEAYLGVPSAGLVLHTLNPRLHPDDLGYITAVGGARTVIVDRSLLPVLFSFIDDTEIENVLTIDDAFVGDPWVGDEYERLLADVDPDDWRDPQLDEREAAALCFTSGTTGRPKGVLYSHRSICLHTLALASISPLGQRVAENDVILPAVPMFHASAWGFPYLAVMLGAELVLAGPAAADPATIVELVHRHRVTWSAGVPTVWLRLLDFMERHPHPEGWDALASLKAIASGGSAVPESLIASYLEHGIQIVQSAGMTETSPMALATDYVGERRHASHQTQLRTATAAGIPLPFVEVRARDDHGVLASYGELEVRGPWVASRYYGHVVADDHWTPDGWLRTGDIVDIGRDGFVRYHDRAKDLIKSGGEWISSIALETALLEHPDIVEAAVIAVPDDVYQERPLAVVVPVGRPPTIDELREFLAPRFAKWWLPDRVVHVSELPRTAAGKVAKSLLRSRFATEP